MLLASVKGLFLQELESLLVDMEGNKLAEPPVEYQVPCFPLAGTGFTTFNTMRMKFLADAVEWRTSGLRTERRIPYNPTYR